MLRLFGVVEFGAGGLMLRLQGEEQRAADAERRGRAEAEEHLAGQAGDRRPAGSKPHLLGWTTAYRSAPPSSGFVRHDCGLPSVRTMRTSC